MYGEYFVFDLYKDNWSNLTSSGKFVFVKNSTAIISNYTILPFVIFHYIVNCNLEDLELFFKVAGFVSFTREEMPYEVAIPDIIHLANKESMYSWSNGLISIEEAKAYVEKQLGAGIIEKFLDIKRKQLAYKKVKLYDKLEQAEEMQDKYGFVHPSIHSR